MNVVLLIGAPGAGKSTLGSYISRNHGCKFLSAGEWIREKGLLESSKDALQSETAALLERNLSGDGLLVLEFVKEINDAYALMQILGKKGARLAQVVLVTNSTMNGRIGFLIERRVNSWQRNAERKVAERTPKWQANAGLLIEFFSSMGVLYTLVPCVWGRKNTTTMRPLIVAETIEGPLDPLLPKGLALQRVDWMVSPRLVTDRTVVEKLTHEAEKIAGLSPLPIPVPHAVVRNQDDVEWVTSVPGRYKVSHKCDGTRYLLIVTEDGQHCFKNRAGFFYFFPVTSPLPNKTILDGELVWGSSSGCFLAFDAIAFAGKRIWGLALPERLAAMQTLPSDETMPPFVHRGLHRQRAPSSDAAVAVLAKRHFDSLPDTLALFPSDGMIFTPTAMPYVLHGLLTYKWQPKRACDIRGDNDLVYECVHNPWKGWHPVAIRWDKTSGCNERIGLKCILGSMLEGPKQVVGSSTVTPPAFSGIVRRTLSKEQCLNPLIERTVEASGLEIFNRRPAGRHIPCRGIVFDGDRLVAAAFESFEDSRKVVTERQTWANASFKFDGTLIIAFVHNHAVRACTRRRTDSEQAIWAQRWLADHAHLDAFVEGWTYAFEAVYAQNTVIVPYTFEGLVFLDAWSPNGLSTAPLDRPALSKRLGAVLCAPSIQCRTTDLWRLLAVPLLSLEGWVVENGNRRSKLVHPAYKAASRLNLHPVRIWQEVRMGGFASTMPEHFRREKSAIIAALERAFDEQRDRLEFDFDAAATWNNDDLKAVIVPMNSSLRTVAVHVEKGAQLKQAAFRAMGFDDPSKLSVHYRRERYFGTLRVELMDRIRPSDTGEMKYYTPSANFAQTFSKGWKNGPGFVTPLIVSVLESTGVMDHVFRYLPMETVAKAMLVCKSWRQAIVQEADFDTRVAKFMDDRVPAAVESSGDEVFITRSDDEGYGSY